MTKEQYLQQLDARLRKLPNHERNEIVQDIREHFAIGLEQGKTEKEIISALGSPQHLAKEMIASYHIHQVENTVSTGNIFRAIWAIIGLSFFNLLIVLAPFIAVVSLIISGWAVSIAGTASPLLVIINPIFYPGTFEWFDLFFSFGFCGLGLFIGIGMYFATKATISGFVKYLKFNMNLVKGGLKHD